MAETKTGWWTSGYNLVDEVEKEARNRDKQFELNKKYGMTKPFGLDYREGDDPANPRNQATVIMISGIAQDRVLEDGTRVPNAIPTSDPFIFHQHTVKNREGIYNKYTCSASLGKCLFCDNKIKRSVVGAFTIIDTRSWVIKGEHYVNSKKILIMTTAQLSFLKETMKSLSTKRSDFNGDPSIVGAKFDVLRKGPKGKQEPKSGNVWTFIERINLANANILNGEGKKVDLTPFDYIEKLRPYDIEDQRVVLNNAVLGESEEEEETEAAKPVPF